LTSKTNVYEKKQKTTCDNIGGDDDSIIDPVHVMMAWISYYLSAILAAAKVEKFTSSSMPKSRQVYGHALLSSTAAAATAVKALTTKKQKNTSNTTTLNRPRIK
jgi:hypothetical protein